MQDFIRGDALEQLQHAWRDAALGASEQAQRHICEVLDLLDRTIAQHSESSSVERARVFIEDARNAAVQSDPLGVILALVAAMQELEPTSGNK